MTWSSSTNQTNYRLQRANNGNFAPVTQTVNGIAANATSWTSGNINRNTTWYFRVQAYNALGASAYVVAQPSPFPAPIN